VRHKHVDESVHLLHHASTQARLHVGGDRHFRRAFVKSVRSQDETLDVRSLRGKYADDPHQGAWLIFQPDFNNLTHNNLLAKQCLYGSDGTGGKDRQCLANTDTLCEKIHLSERLFAVR
jgi:hypothetical protein